MGTTDVKISFTEIGASRVEMATGRLGGALARLKTQAAAANATLLHMNERLANVRWAMVNIAFVAAAVAAAFAPFVLMGKNFTEFEQGVYKISAATGEAADNIKSKLADASSGSVFALNDISASFLEINKAGFEATDAMTVVKNAQTLAIAGFSDLDDAASLLITTLNAYNMSGAEAGYVTEVIAKVANATASDVETLGTALSYVVGNAYQLGLTLPEVVGMLGVLQNAGLTSSKAGTSLNQALQSLIKPSVQASDVMSRLGVAWQDSDGKARNTVDVLEDLKNATSGYANSAEILANIFGARGSRAVNMLFNQANAAGKSIQEVAMELQKAGGASENVSTQMESNANRMAQAWNSLKNTFTTSKTAEFFSNLGTHAVRGADLVVRAIDKMAQSAGTLEYAKKQLMYGPFAEIGLMKDAASNIKEEQAQNKAYMNATALEKLAIDIANAKKDGRLEDEKELKAQYDLLNVREQLHDLTMEAFDVQVKSSGETAELAKQQYENYGKVGSRIEEISQLMKLYNITVTEAVDKLLEMETVGDYFEISAEEANKLAKALESVNNYWDDFWKSISQVGENSQIKQISGWIDDISIGSDMEASVMRDDGTSEGVIKAMESDYQDMINVLTGYREEMRDAQAEVDDLNVELTAMDALIKQTTASLKSEQRELSSWQSKLSEINSTISDLTNARYKDQTATEKLMSAGELWLKKEELAERGITDAHGYIQEMLAKSEHGYYKLFDSITAVNDAVDDGKLTYEAWRETVSAFIEETVASGNKLGQNVSGSVTQYQTLLMSTSKYQEDSSAETSRIDAVEETIRNLKDAYDVYYGDMMNDVKYSVQAHEEEATGVYDSSEQVVSALQNQWVAQAQAADMVKIHEGRVNELTLALENQKSAYSGIKAKINELKDSFDTLISKAKQAMEAMKEALEMKEAKQDAKSDSSSSGSSTYVSGGSALISTSYDPKDTSAYSDAWSELYAKNAALVGAAPYATQEPSSASTSMFGTGTLPKDWSTPTLFNDFIMRPGQKPISFSPSDTLVGTKSPSDAQSIAGNSGGGGVTINTINVNGATGNGEEFADDFARELRRELRTL